MQAYAVRGMSLAPHALVQTTPAEGRVGEEVSGGQSVLLGGRAPALNAHIASSERQSESNQLSYRRYSSQFSSHPNVSSTRTS